MLLFSSRVPEKDKEGNYWVKVIHLSKIFSDLGLSISEKESQVIRAEFEVKHSDGKVPLEELEAYLTNYLTGYSK